MIHEHVRSAVVWWEGGEQKLQELPSLFWDLVSDDKLMEMRAREGWLDSAERVRAWRLCERQGPPPAEMVVMLNRADIDRIWPQKRRRR